MNPLLHTYYLLIRIGGHELIQDVEATTRANANYEGLIIAQGYKDQYNIPGDVKIEIFNQTEWSELRGSDDN